MHLVLWKGPCGINLGVGLGIYLVLFLEKLVNILGRKNFNKIKRKLNLISMLLNISEMRDQRRDKIVEVKPERLVGKLDLRWEDFFVLLSTVVQAGQSPEVLSAHNTCLLMSLQLYFLRPFQKSGSKPLSSWYRVVGEKISVIKILSISHCLPLVVFPYVFLKSEVIWGFLPKITKQKKQ